MKEKTGYPPSLITAEMIAPCGMNCALCIGFLRERRPCAGCNGDDTHKPKHCVECAIRHCEEMGQDAGGFCTSCSTLPCARLKRLDKRYVAKYGMSMLENLKAIERLGLERFVEQERDRWTCPGCGSLICVHQEECMVCGRARGEAEAA